MARLHYFSDNERARIARSCVVESPAPKGISPDVEVRDQAW
jgi:hypothetical protein